MNINEKPMRTWITGSILALAIAGIVISTMYHPVVASNTGNTSLSVTVTGIASGKGTILGSVCDKTTFLKQCSALSMAPANNNGVTQLQFEHIVPGQYAVMVFHDENDNRHFDTSTSGIPLEGYGFSRDAKGRYGPPTFDDAMIEIKPGKSAISIALSY